MEQGLLGAMIVATVAVPVWAASSGESRAGAKRLVFAGAAVAVGWWAAVLAWVQ